MNHIKTVLKVLLAIACLLQLTACAKTVQWDEEVPLNTGETIWVKRSDSYVKGGEPGNPLKMTWGIEKRRYEFSWQGQFYVYETEPKVSLGVLLIHALPADKTVAIIDAARNCEKAGYGEFRWVDGRWQLQQKVSQAFIGLPRNLMAFYSDDASDIPARVDRAFRHQADTAPNRGKKILSLEESRVAINCSRSK